eukprot:Rmarinus@m.26040
MDDKESPAGVAEWITGLLSPGVSKTAHDVMFYSLVGVILLSALMIYRSYDVFGIHAVVMLLLAVGLMLSYLWFMHEFQKLNAEEDTSKGNRTSASKKPSASKSGKRKKR